MFNKILIANRGEIACRIIRTARRMGVGTVAVYSEADRDALHVEMADEAVAIGPAPAAQSYLLIDKIIAACRATGAQAVHPGYGFLSERASFATALADNGVVFIGPNPKAIAAMGDKIESKRFAAAAGVATVPGHLGAVEDAERAAAIADAIGYPVMIKASAGGGGKGMRVAHNRAEVAEGFARARSEALSAFGDDRLLVEKFIVDPRHIEIQVLGDKRGSVIHLGERECSIQRRNQKVVEEAPSPFVDAAMRRRMGEQAVALAKAVNYDSAGTVEFVVGQDREFYFLEMNTRLQVEHGVTELVTGVDLVEEMIRSAYGLALRTSQRDVKLQGWAIEARIYAEDPARGFLPSTGRLVKYRPPSEGAASGVTLRNDTGVHEGSEVSIHYDPMIAKLVAHAPDRAAAIAAQAEALDAFVIDGVRHNIPFLSALMQHERWRAGRLSTGFIAEEYPRGFTPPIAAGETELALAAIAAHADFVASRRARAPAGRQDVGHSQRSKCSRARAPAGRLRPSTRQSEDFKRVVSLGAARIAITLAPAADALGVIFAQSGRTLRVASNWRPGELVWRGAIDGEPRTAQLRPILNGFALAHRGVAVEARVYGEREAALAALMIARSGAETSTALRCPMPGLVKSIAVREGQAVRAGEGLCVVEAMKMENLLTAERDGTVKTILVKPGQSLAVDAVIIEFA